jgi:hypothetical protein
MNGYVKKNHSIKTLSNITVTRERQQGEKLHGSSEQGRGWGILHETVYDGKVYNGKYFIDRNGHEQGKRNTGKRSRKEAICRIMATIK